MPVIETCYCMNYMSNCVAYLQKLIDAFSFIDGSRCKYTQISICLLYLVTMPVEQKHETDSTFLLVVVSWAQGLPNFHSCSKEESTSIFDMKNYQILDIV